MIRRSLVQWCCLALLAACSAEQPQTDAAEQQPNILLIVADDLGNNDLGAFGDGSATTPNIDALAATGVRFSRHYAQSTCRPSRVELLTGKSASQVAVPPHFRGIGPQHITLPEALREGGYRTVHLGKWHLGHNVESAKPAAQGFDSWYGFLHALMTRDGSMQTPAASYLNPWLQGSDSPLAKRQGHLTDLLTDAAVERIHDFASAEQPWFLNLWYFAPHNPIEPAPRFAREFPDTREGRYLALVAQLDAGVGRVLEALEASDQLDNTLVIFVSDNGGINKVRDSNKPYFGKKNTFYEGGLRTPLILSQPGVLLAAEVVAPVFIRDLMPTLLGFAGVEPVPDLDGSDLRPLLEGRDVPRPQHYYWDMRLQEWAFWGLLDLAEDRLFYAGELQLREGDTPFFGAPRKASEVELEKMRSGYLDWQLQVSRARLERSQKRADGYLLSGDDYRRTPGFGGWSLQVPVDPGRPLSRLVFQDQQLELQMGDGEIRLQLPGIAATVATSQQGCQLLTVSTYYRWPAHYPGKSSVTAQIYLGEVKAFEEERKVSSAILVDAYPPTRVAADAGQVVISNHQLNSRLLESYRAATGAGPACRS